MSLYTVRLLKGNQRPHPIFKNKGLDNFFPCSLSNCEVYGIPHKRQIAYAAYVQSLSAFLFATEKQTRVTVEAEGYPIKLSTTQILDVFDIVPLGVTFSKKPSADRLQDLEKDYGVRQVRNQGQDILIFDHVTLDLAREMMASKALPDARTPSGVANLHGLHSYTHCMKVVTLFCVCSLCVSCIYFLKFYKATHTYPAYSTPLDDEDTVHNFVADSEARIPIEEMAPSNKRRRIIPEPGIDVDLMDEDVAEIADNKRRVICLKEVVLNAKPAPFYPAINFGPITSVPVSSGLVCPYFYQMITPDFQIIPDIMRDYFLQTFGANRDEVIQGFKKWAKYSKTWIESPAGIEMQHIFFGIRLALQSQARVYFIREHGKYLGFCLLGEGFSIVAQGSEFLPVSAEEVRNQLARVSFHDNALAEICTMLSQCKLKNNKRKGVRPSDITSNRGLYEECLTRNVSEDEREALMKLTNDLSFPERYWRPSVENITRAIQIYCDNEGDHSSGDPMYIGGGMLFNTSEAFKALSVFGPTAPSFFTVGGEKKDIPAPGKPDPLSVPDPSTGKPMLPVIPYTMKSIRTADSDLYKVWKDKAIYILPKERAGPSRSTQFTGKARDMMWSGLRNTIGERSIATTEAKKDPVADRKDVSKGKEIAYADELDFD
jgi:hypothetical protein